MKTPLLVSLIVLLCSGKIHAQTKDSTSSIVFGGFMDAYYTYNFNKYAGKDIPYAYNHSRNNEINANLVLLTAKYASSGVRANVGLQAGTYTMTNYSAEPTILQHIYDANAGVQLLNHVWLDAGIFGSSHIGFESAISKDNWTLTRSMSAENTPYYAAGAELNYEPSSKLLVSFILCNGWQVIRDNNSNKGLCYQVTYKPNDKFGFNTSSFYGEGHNAPDSLALMRYFNHFYAYYLFGKFNVAAMFDIGLEQSSKGSSDYNVWYNPTVLLKYTINSKWATCLRGEYYGDENGVVVSTLSGKQYNNAGASLNIDYLPYSNVALRLEGKYFNSQQAIYQSNGGFITTQYLLTSSLAVWF